jgi:hypothetical protein
MTSAVLIIPAAVLDDANAVGLALGHGPNNYTVPLASDADPGTVTHYGARADVSSEFIAVVAAGKAGTLPPVDWSAVGIDETRALAVVDALVADFDEAGAHPSPLAHWSAALAAHGLVRSAT